MVALFLSYNSYPLSTAYGKEKVEKEEKVEKGEKEEKVEEKDLPYIGVLDLEAKEGIPTSAIAPLSDSLRKEFFDTKKFKVLDRKNMHVILKEQGFQQIGCTSSECAVEAGRMLGVEKMVTGNIARLGDTYYISVTVTNVETGEVESIADEKRRGEIELLFDAIGSIVEKITGVPRKAPVPEKTHGSLNISSQPEGVQIFLDEEPVGVSPSILKDIEPGEHKLGFKKEGYHPYETKVKVGTEEVPVKVMLKKLEFLKVSGEPADAQISLDGSALGSSPQEVQIAPGAHKIEVTKPGYEPYTQEFKVAEGESYNISYSLEEIKEVTPEEEEQISEEGVPKEEKGFGISLAPRFARGDGNILGVGMRLQPRISKSLWLFAGGFYSVFGSVGGLKALSDGEEVEIDVKNRPEESYMIGGGIVYALPFFEKWEMSFEAGYDYCSTGFKFTETDSEETDRISVKGSGHHEALNLSYYSSGHSAITFTVGYIGLPSLPDKSEDDREMSDEIGFSGLLLELRLGYYW